MRLASVLLCAVGCLPLAMAPAVVDAAAAASPGATQATTANGFVPIRADARSGEVRIDIAPLTTPFLLVATLEQAIGSNDIGLDRAQNAEPLLVEFRRVGKRAMLVQRNTRFVADSPDRAEAAAARDAFAEAILWSGPIVADAGGEWVDIGSLLTSDRIGVADRLAATKQGKYALAADRSAVLAEASRSFPDNAEFAALLTFAGDGEGAFVRQAAADPKTITVRQRLSFVRLPSPGFRPRAYHPASGGYSIGRFDFSQPIDRSLDVRLQPRFRLEKTDPTAARSRVVKPIVFYLDRGTPEPVRSALIEGGNWWKAAFEAAGFIDAFRVELAPEGMAMSDVRYNTITWTHRATRGWSYGGGLIDPRTGEILKGYVNLGSQRVRQDLLIAEGLLAPYAAGADPALREQARAMALQRLRQLAAHEIGHALGFAHNFAASRTPGGSVLDYPHPVITLDADGRPQLAAPYGNGVGEWDTFLVAHAYGQFAPHQEAAALSQLRADIAAKGYRYVSDPDARTSENAHSAGLLWDVPGDPMAGLSQLLQVRKAALSRFALGALPPDRETGDTERRLVPIYLLHRYQAEAVIRLIGGGDYGYGLIGDGALGVTPVDAKTQREALSATADLLSMSTLDLPDSVLGVLTPPSNEYGRTPEYFDTRSTPLFDPPQAVSAASALIAAQAFQPERLNRLAWQHARDAQIPSVTDVFQRLVAAPWAETAASPSRTPLRHARDWTLLDAALLALDEGRLQPAVAVEWRTALDAFATTHANARDPQRAEAARRVRRYLDDPASIKLRPLPPAPPGPPI
jgi:hypothetical protein